MLSHSRWTATAALTLAPGLLSCASGRSAGMDWRPYGSGVVTYESRPAGSPEGVLVFLGLVPEWPAPHDTIAELTGGLPSGLARYRTFGGRETPRYQDYDRGLTSASGCRSVQMIPGDSIRPQRMVCLQWETATPRSVEVPTPPDFGPLRELAWHLGGHGVIVAEAPTGRTRFWVIRCAVRGGSPACL